MMRKQEVILLRKARDFSGSISVTFDFLRENFKPLYKSLLLIGGGIMIVSYTIGFLITNLLETSSANDDIYYENLNDYDMMPTFGSIWVSNGLFMSNYILIYIVFFISTLVVIAITYRYLLLYPKYGKDISPAFLWSQVRRDLWPVFQATFLFYIIIACGVAMIGVSALSGWFVILITSCILIYVIIPISLIHIIMLAENMNPIEAVKRSMYLIKDNWWSTFGVMLVTSLIIYVISMVVYLPATMAGFFISFNSIDVSNSGLESDEVMTAFTIALTILYSMSFFFSLPVSYLALGFQYFSIIEAKEHVGLIERIETIGSKKV